MFSSFRFIKSIVFYFWKLLKILFLFILGFNIYGNTVPANIGSSFLELFKKNKDSIVRVKASFLEKEEEPREVHIRSGSGFFVTQEGHILVNSTKVIGAERINVEFHEKVYAAEAIGHDALNNVSLIRLLKLPNDFSFVNLEDKDHQISIGQFLMSISCPLEFGVSPNLGILTGIDKEIGKQPLPTAYYRTNIPIDSGRGGSPIFDLNGNFLGISILSIPTIRESYFIPNTTLKSIVNDLMFSGEPQRGLIGIEVSEKILDNFNYLVSINDFMPESPAQEAGMKKGDQIISFNGEIIYRARDLAEKFFKIKVGQSFKMKVLRNKKEINFDIEAGKRN